jgi:hypothetical protein
MAKKVYEETYIASIGQRIREKTGTQKKYKTREMSAGVGEVYEAGKKAGKKAECEAFWNSAVNADFSSVDGTYRFAGSCWNDETFKPPKKITLYGNCNACFYACKVTDITPYIGFRGVDSFSQAFSYSKIKKVSHIYVDVSKAVSLSSTFTNGAVEWVEGLTVGENTKFSSTFNSASKLTHIIFYGTIGQNGMNMSSCTLLDKDSITSIINVLSTTTSGLSVTLSKSSVNKAFETSVGANDGSTSAEWLNLVSTRSNWTIALA